MATKVKTLLSASMLCLAANAVCAEEASTGVKLSIEKADRALAALSKLDTYDKIDREGKGVKVSFEFSGKTRLKIAKDIGVLGDVIKKFGVARNGLIKQELGLDVLPAPGSDELKKLMVGAEFTKLTHEVEDLMKEEQVIDVEFLSEAELKLDVNPISPGDIAGMRPLIRN